MHEEALQVLVTHAKEFGIGLSDHQLGLFQIYLDELVLWNKRMNLTGAKSPARMVIELFLDSLVPSAMIPSKTTLLDAGSGAGLPGLPLKILNPNLEVHLLESRAKRVSFLRQVVRLMGLAGIEVIQGRIEKGAAVFPVECYPVITARAFAPFPRTLRWCSPLLCSRGMLVCYLGEHAPEEVASSAAVAREQELEVEETLPYSLPGKKGLRHVVILRKTSERE
jgi:16S rRNA (guanine527-N7)-methyltransferase